MQYTTTYSSPIGEILLAADEIGLTGLWFKEEKFYALCLDPNHEEKLPLSEGIDPDRFSIPAGGTAQ